MAFAKLFGDTLLTKAGEKPTEEVLAGKTAVGVYFSAHWCPPCRGFTPQLAQMYTDAFSAKGMEIVFVSGDKDAAADQIRALYDLFVARDCTMVEVNPLAEDIDGNLIAADAKIGFDDNAEFRQKAIHEQRDESQENPIEVEAKKHDLNYIKLDGNVACMVNGAGLAMSTMDLLAILGGSPANFLDVGGASTVETMTAAFKIIGNDPNVKSIFVNIFGGIARCDNIATAVVAGVNAVGAANVKPLVVRLEGTNVEAGMKIIKDSGINAFLTNDFTEGAKKAVEIATK